MLAHQLGGDGSGFFTAPAALGPTHLRAMGSQVWQDPGPGGLIERAGRVMNTPWVNWFCRFPVTQRRGLGFVFLSNPGRSGFPFPRETSGNRAPKSQTQLSTGMGAMWDKGALNPPSPSPHGHPSAPLCQFGKFHIGCRHQSVTSGMCPWNGAAGHHCVMLGDKSCPGRVGGEKEV